MEKAVRHLPAGCLLLALGFAAATSPAGAQSYPSGMIRIIGATAAGTPPDIVGRIIANELAESEGWRVVVENKPGAIQTIGAAEALKQPADGYTIAVDRAAGFGRARPPAQRELSARHRFRAGDQARDAYHVLVVHPVGSGQVAVRARRAAQEPAGQADILVRRLRHARPSRRRDVQAANRRARDPRALPGRCREPSAICSTERTTTSSSRRCPWSS